MTYRGARVEQGVRSVTDLPRAEGTYPEESRATTALVLGVLGLVGFGILAPFAWYVGWKELRAIDVGRRPPENRGTAVAGMVLGIVGTAILAVVVVAVLFVGAVLVAYLLAAT